MEGNLFPTQAQQDIEVTPTTSASIWSSQHWRLTIGLLLQVIGTAFEALAVASTLPVTVQDIGGIELYGWAFSAFMLTNLIGVVLAGNLADRRGPLLPMMIGAACFVFGLVVAGSAPSMPIMIVGRAVQGFGAGFVYSLALYCVARAYPSELRARMFAMISSAWIIPSLVGPVLAGFIAEYVGWRWVFLGLVPFVPIAMLLTVPVIRRLKPAQSAEAAPLASAITLSVGTGLAINGLGQASLVAALPLVLIGMVLMVVALRRLLPQGTLVAANGLGAAIALAGLLHIAFFGIDTFVPLLLTTVRQQPASIAGLTLTAGALCWTAGTWVQTHFVGRYSLRWMATAGLGVFVLGIAGLGVSLNGAVPVAMTMVCWGVAGIGMGFTYAICANMVFHMARAGGEGKATSSLQLVSILGIAIGTGLGGAIMARSGAQAHNISGSMLVEYVLMASIIGIATIAAARLPTQM